MQKRVINVDKDILSGTLVFYGTRVPIKNLFDYLETGDTIDDFLEDSESVSRGQIIDVLQISQTLIEKSLTTHQK